MEVLIFNAGESVVPQTVIEFHSLTREKKIQFDQRPGLGLTMTF